MLASDEVAEASEYWVRALDNRVRPLFNHPLDEELAAGTTLVLHGLNCDPL